MLSWEMLGDPRNGGLVCHGNDYGIIIAGYGGFWDEFQDSATYSG